MVSANMGVNNKLIIYFKKVKWVVVGDLEQNELRNNQKTAAKNEPNPVPPQSSIRNSKKNEYDAVEHHHLLDPVHPTGNHPGGKIEAWPVIALREVKCYHRQANYEPQIGVRIETAGLADLDRQRRHCQACPKRGLTAPKMMRETVGESHLSQRTCKEQPSGTRDSLPEQPERCGKESVDAVPHAADV